mmetsp:Transcript_77380/g.171329  ORF Transcript_77380/g.171329 Transcript_77380/m.171329 type:complete len:280 (+) Transcript_77380:144-983(+)
MLRSARHERPLERSLAGSPPPHCKPIHRRMGDRPCRGPRLAATPPMQCLHRWGARRLLRTPVPKARLAEGAPRQNSCRLPRPRCWQRGVACAVRRRLPLVGWLPHSGVQAVLVAGLPCQLPLSLRRWTHSRRRANACTRSRRRPRRHRRRRPLGRRLARAAPPGHPASARLQAGLARPWVFRRGQGRRPAPLRGPLRQARAPVAAARLRACARPRARPCVRLPRREREAQLLAASPLKYCSQRSRRSSDTTTAPRRCRRRSPTSLSPTTSRAPGCPQSA